MTRVLVLGGARSGKSAFAESLLQDASSVEYVATGRPGTDDAEWAQRIRAHRSRRPAHWTTTETGDVAAVLRAPGPPVLVDSVTTWLAALLDASDLRARTDEFVSSWAATTRRAVAVTDEVGWSVVPHTASGRHFRDELGRLNQRLAAAADEAYLVVAGLAMQLK